MPFGFLYMFHSDSVLTGAEKTASRKLLVLITSLSFLLFSYYAYQVAMSLRYAGQKVDASDFGLILCGSRAFLMNHANSPYQACAGSDPLSGFLYPPLSILLLAPLATLSNALAFISLTIFSLVLLAIILASIRSLAPEHLGRDKRDPWVLSLLILALAPVMQTLVAGHLNVVILAAFILPLLLANQRLYVASGLIIAVGFWIKLYPIILAFLFISHRDLRPAGLWAMGWTIALALLGLIWIPLTLHVEYFTRFMPALQKFTVPGYSESIAAQLLFLQGNSANIDAWNSEEVPLALRLTSNLVLVIGFGLAMLRIRRAAASKELQFEALAILLLAVLLCSPLAWGHHFVLAIPAVALLLMRLTDGPSLVAKLVVAACWLCLALPSWTRLPGIFSQLPGHRFAADLFYIRYTVSALGMMGLLVARGFRADIAMLSNRRSMV